MPETLEWWCHFLLHGQIYRRKQRQKPLNTEVSLPSSRLKRYEMVWYQDSHQLSHSWVRRKATNLAVDNLPELNRTVAEATFRIAAVISKFGLDFKLEAVVKRPNAKLYESRFFSQNFEYGKWQVVHSIKCDNNSASDTHAKVRE